MHKFERIFKQPKKRKLISFPRDRLISRTSGTGFSTTSKGEKRWQALWRKLSSLCPAQAVNYRIWLHQRQSALHRTETVSIICMSFIKNIFVQITLNTHLLTDNEQLSSILY